MFDLKFYDSSDTCEPEKQCFRHETNFTFLFRVVTGFLNVDKRCFVVGRQDVTNWTCPLFFPTFASSTSFFLFAAVIERRKKKGCSASNDSWRPQWFFFPVFRTVIESSYCPHPPVTWSKRNLLRFISRYGLWLTHKRACTCFTYFDLGFSPHQVWVLNTLSVSQIVF